MSAKCGATRRRERPRAAAKAQSGLHTNVVTANGTDTRTSRTTSDTDAASYRGVDGAIRVEKAINAVHVTAPTRYEDADAPTGPILQVGSPIVWTYQVFNQSGAELDIVDLLDSDGFTPAMIGGDSDGDGRLDAAEVWLFTSAGVTGAPATALAGQHANTVTVRASDDAGRIVTDDDKAHYFGTIVTPTTGISIVKAVNAVDPASPTVQEDANDADRPFLLTAGSVPTWTLQVKNLGTNALKDIQIVDDATTDPAGDDFAPLPVQRGQNNVGDANRNGLLDPGETWLYTSAGVYKTVLPQGAYVNVAQVVATDTITGTQVRDDDTAHLVVVAPVHSQGRMTGGGSVYTEDGMRVTHGFELHCDIDVGPNNLEVNFDKNSFHLEQLTAVNCYDDPALNPLPRPAPFDTLVGEGIGRFNNQPGYKIRFTFTDDGEPGTTDLAQIEIRDPQGKLVLFVSGNLHNGNHQAHPENKTASPLLAAAAPAAMATAMPNVDAAQLAQSIDAARRQWSEAGLSAEQTARLGAIQVEMADLPGLTLGEALDDHIVIDADAAGWGWFVDPTPQDDGEFMRDGGALIATAGPAAGRMDLMTVLVHEMGHAIGLGHSDGGVMDGRLTAGHRAAPELDGRADALDAAPAALSGVSGAATEAARPAIDWSSLASIAATDRDVAAQLRTGAAGPWQQRFVNHLGASAELSHPNAGLRLHLPVAAEASPRMSRV